MHEATVANIVRAYVTVKTHPVKKSIRLRRRKMEREKDKKEDYADWQLLGQCVGSDTRIDKHQKVTGLVSQYNRT